MVLSSAPRPGNPTTACGMRLHTQEPGADGFDNTATLKFVHRTGIAQREQTYNQQE